MSAEQRKKLIDEASQYVTVDRNTSYGEPEDNFQAIADVWNAQGVRLSEGRNFDSHRFVTSTDVALMMAGMKLARLRGNPGHRDSWVDLIGYAACGGDIALPVEGEPVAEMMDAIRGVGRWVSDNRCTGPLGYPHVAHTYGGHSDRSANWCDGYVVEPLPRMKVVGKADLPRSPLNSADDCGATDGLGHTCTLRKGHTSIGHVQRLRHGNTVEWDGDHRSASGLRCSYITTLGGQCVLDTHGPALAHHAAKWAIKE